MTPSRPQMMAQMGNLAPGGADGLGQPSLDDLDHDDETDSDDDGLPDLE